MSFKVSALAWMVPVEKSTERLVLLALADRADDEGKNCYPSVETICGMTQMNRKTVFAVISRLAERGVLSVRKREVHNSNEYLLHIEDWPENGTTQKRDNPKTVRQLSRKRDDGCTENGTTVVPKTGHEPINEPINNQSITSREDTPPKARAKKGEAWKKWIKVEKPAEVPDDLWKQFGEIRALKKRALTESALELLRSEGEKAHMTLLQVIEHCCANAWAGFRASWLTRTSGSTYRKPQNVTQTAEYRERLQACCRGEGRTEKLADDGVTIIVD